MRAERVARPTAKQVRNHDGQTALDHREGALTSSATILVGVVGNVGNAGVVDGHVTHALQQLAADHDRDDAGAHEHEPERRHEAGKDQEVHLAEAPDQLGGNEQDGDLARSGDRTQDAHEVLTLAKLDRVAAQERPDEANRGRTDEGEDQDEGDLIAGEQTL